MDVHNKQNVHFGDIDQFLTFITIFHGIQLTYLYSVFNLFSVTCIAYLHSTGLYILSSLWFGFFCLQYIEVFNQLS